MNINEETGRAPSLFVWSPLRLADGCVGDCVSQSHVVEPHGHAALLIPETCPL